MKIGVIGAGRMSQALSTRWAKKGHELMISGRTPDRAQALAARIGGDATHGSLQEACEFGEVVLIAVRREGVLPTLQAAGAAEGSLIGKTVIDCNNTVDTTTFMQIGAGGPSLAEQIAAVASGSRVVKAFNLCHYKVWEMRAPEFDGRQLTVPVAGNEQNAKAQVEELAGDLGCLTRDVGPLHRARVLEATGALMIGILFSGAPALTVLNLVDAPG